MPIATKEVVGIDRTHLNDFITRIANPEQATAHGRAAFAIWNNGQSWEVYSGMLREERERSAWGVNGRVLVHREDPEGPIYAGCETYRMDGWVKHRGSDQIENTHVYGIASVVTLKQHLRKGYATRLLSLLHHQLGATVLFPSTWGDTPRAPPIDLVPRGIGSFLWSDVGSDFYERCSVGSSRPGWVVNDRQSSALVWRVLPTDYDPATPVTADTSDWIWIWEADLPAVAQLLSVEAEERVRAASSHDYAVWQQDPASAGTLSFVSTKGSWYRQPRTQPFPFGIRIRSAGPKQEDAIVLFSLSHPSIGPRLHITYVAYLTAELVPTLLRALDGIAAREGLQEGWLWDVDSSSELVTTWQGLERRAVSVGKRPEVDGHLLGVAWYGEEESAKLLDGQMWSWV